MGIDAAFIFRNEADDWAALHVPYTYIQATLNYNIYVAANMCVYQCVWCRRHLFIDVVIENEHSVFMSRDDFSKVLGKTYLIININKKTIYVSVVLCPLLPPAEHS